MAPTPDQTMASFLAAINGPGLGTMTASAAVTQLMAQFSSNPVVGITNGRGPVFTGITAVQNLFTSLFIAFPNLSFGVVQPVPPLPSGAPSWLHSVETPTRVTVEAVLGGTHQGAWAPRGAPSSPINNVQPTNLPFTVDACAIFSFDPNSGLITRLAVYFDRWKVMADLNIGYTPTGASPPF
ncbi:MAG: hypothetical protein ABSG46_15930 [Candidatus Binataceae bacterium]